MSNSSRVVVGHSFKLKTKHIPQTLHQCQGCLNRSTLNPLKFMKISLNFMNYIFSTHPNLVFQCPSRVICNTALYINSSWHSVFFWKQFLSHIFTCSTRESEQILDLIVEKGEIIDVLQQLGDLLQKEMDLSKELNDESSRNRYCAVSIEMEWSYMN